MRLRLLETIQKSLRRLVSFQNGPDAWTGQIGNMGGESGIPFRLIFSSGGQIAGIMSASRRLMYGIRRAGEFPWRSALLF